MTTRITMALAALFMVVSACADGGVYEDDSGTGNGNTEPTTSTSLSVSTTTVASATTTTVGPNSGVQDIDIMRAAFAATADVTSGRMEGLTEMTGLDLSGGFTEMVIPFVGAFNNASGDMSSITDLSFLALSNEELLPESVEFFVFVSQMEVRVIGDTAYMKYPFLMYSFGVQTLWIEGPALERDSTDGFPMSIQANPSEILGALAKEDATVDVVGTETVNGVDATHYRAVFDTAALLEQASPEERGRLEMLVLMPTDSLLMDVWISADGLVVRFIMEFDGDSVEPGPWGSFDRTVMRYDMFEFNSDITIEPPPPGEVTHVDDLDLPSASEL